MVEFKFNIGEQVTLKTNPQTILTVHKIKKGKYLLNDQDGFQHQHLFDERQLVNKRKKEFLSELKKTREQQAADRQQQSALFEEIKWYLKSYLNYQTSVRPAKALFIKSEMSPELKFYWQEEDWQGYIFAVYCGVYKNTKYFLTVKSYFGSCSGCDGWRNCDTQEEHQEYIDKLYSSIEVYNSKLDILTILKNNKYLHPDCKNKLQKLVL